MTTAARVPLSARPRYEGTGASQQVDAERFLGKASAYLEDGGEWSEDLRAYVDTWLDALSALNARAEIKMLPEAKVAR